MNSKKFLILLSSFLCLGLLVTTALVIYVDPFFHYHAPIEGLSYILDNEMYQNDGVLKYFDYDAVIMGSSMTQNFSTDEFDKLFSVNSVKTSLSSMRAKEIGHQLNKMLDYNHSVKKVLLSFDAYWFTQSKDNVRGSAPDYLYDSNIINDIEYWYNKDVVFKYINTIIINTLRGKEAAIDFNSYGRWMEIYPYGKEIVLKYYNRDDIPLQTEKPFDEQAKASIYENIYGNIISIIKENQNIDFYIFFPPYSIVWFDQEIRKGNYLIDMEGMRYLTEILLECQNVKLFIFFDNYDLTTNLELYKDEMHYVRSINTDILNRIHDDKYLLTKENYNQRFDDIIDFYKNYDYDTIFE